LIIWSLLLLLSRRQSLSRRESNYILNGLTIHYSAATTTALTPPSRVSSPHSLTKCVRVSLSRRRLITRGDKLCTIYLHYTIIYIYVHIAGRFIIQTNAMMRVLEKWTSVTIACNYSNPAGTPPRGIDVTGGHFIHHPTHHRQVQPSTQRYIYFMIVLKRVHKFCGAGSDLGESVAE